MYNEDTLKVFNISSPGLKAKKKTTITDLYTRFELAVNLDGIIPSILEPI